MTDLFAQDAREMETYHVTGIGLVGGEKDTLRWDGDKLSGPEVLKDRCLAFLSSLSQPDILVALNSKFHAHRCRLNFIEDAIRRSFDELLDLYTERFESPEILAKRAEAWNAHGGDRHWTLEDLQSMEIEDNRKRHQGPPYSWDEIEDCLSEKQQPLPCPPPVNLPKCISCLDHMEWIWFCSSSWTWQHLCGRAGWTPICRKCKTWRPCDEMVIS